MKLKCAHFCAALVLLLGIVMAGCGGGSNTTVSIISPTSVPTIEATQTVNVMAAVSSGNPNMMGQGVAWSLSGVGCTGAACGSLSNQTTSSVTYHAPASVPANLTVSVIASSLADPSKSAALTVQVLAISVTIQNKVTEYAAGIYPNQPFNNGLGAAVQNDPNNAGVNWTLTANGAACSPACGTLGNLGNFNPGAYFYVPPATVPTAPNNTPTITATSVTDPTKSDTETLTIFNGTTACGSGGNESLLNGQYAIMLQGWVGSGSGTPLLFGASFAADGTGKITQGQEQVNPYVNYSISGLSVIPSASGYSVGPDNRGCLTLTDQSENTYTLHFALGAISGGAATRGDVILFNQQSSTPEYASGILRRQDPTAFSLNALAANYALGLDGWSGGPGSLMHFAMAGSFAQNGGNLSNGYADVNNGGSLLSDTNQVPGASFGNIQSVAPLDGMTYATLDIPGSFPADVTIYIINAYEFFIISNDLSGSTSAPIFSGRAIATSSAFTASSLGDNYIFQLTGTSSGSPAAAIGMMSLSGGLTGNVSGTIDQYTSGTASDQAVSGSYTFDQTSGRLAVTGTSASNSPICYLADASEDVSGFCISTDASASSGAFNVQPAATYSNSSLAGTFFFGCNKPMDNSIPGISGTVSVSSGNLTGTKDTSSPSAQTIGSTITLPLSISANGSGTLGANTVMVTNGSVIYFINEADGAAAQVQVFEQ